MRSGRRFRTCAKVASLKQYRSRSAPVSIMSDKKDSPARLWDSEVVSVQHSVGEPVPEFCQLPEDGSKRPSAVDAQDVGDVFPDDPPRPLISSKSKKLKGQ